MTEESQIKKQKIIFGEKSKKTQGYKLENFRLSYLKRIFSALKIPGKGKYLDVGCGSLGYLVIEAARLGQEATGIELSREMVSKARNFAQKELGRKNLCHFVIGQAEKLPFPNSSFSKISAVAVLEHIRNDGKAIAEVARVLKPRGKIFLTVPNSYQKIWPPFRWYYRRVDREMGHLRHYEAKDLQQRFENYGLDLVNLAYTGHLPKVIQYFLTLVFPFFVNSSWWWKLEELDFNMSNNSSGLHFDLVMEKQKND